MSVTTAADQNCRFRQHVKSFAGSKSESTFHEDKGYMRVPHEKMAWIPTWGRAPLSVTVFATPKKQARLDFTMLCIRASLNQKNMSEMRKIDQEKDYWEGVGRGAP